MKGLITIFASFILTSFSFAQSSPPVYKYVFTVAKDGTGDYKYIQDAIDAMRVYPLHRIVLYIKNGVYNEKINLPADNTDVEFIGESVDKTIIQFNDYSGRGHINTFTSYTAKISGNRFRAENISFVNDAGRVGQALALYVDADQALFLNCRFIGNQDTVFTGGENARQYFYNCYVEGTTDFIFGPATAVFSHCNIRCKANSFISAANTPKGHRFGLLFLNCEISCDSSLTHVMLGRPWRAFAKTAYLRCNMPAQIDPAGWNNWQDTNNERSTFYAEYNNRGEGSATAKRVSWYHVLTDSEAASYVPATIFADGKLVTDTPWFMNTQVNPFSWPLKN